MCDNITIEFTADGSQTLYSDQFGAHYHSRHGALQESKHVFIQEGLEHYIQKNSPKIVHILEYGMGTGLNVLLTKYYADIHDIKIIMHSVEGYPIPEHIYKQLSYRDISQELLIDLHEQAWGAPLQITPAFELTKEKSLFEKFTTDRKYDIIYFDAFAPSAQPHLWTEDILKTAIASLTDQGVLVTFCAQGAFKRILKTLGMTVERVPGPPGKREMTRGTLAL